VKISALATIAALPLCITLALEPGPQVQHDVAFLPDHRPEKADLFLPAIQSDGKPTPAVLIIHGGGWVAGRKDSPREVALATALAERGFAAMNIDYKLGTPDGSVRCWPQNLHDCKTAIRWLRANSKHLNIDPDNIGVIGLSSGGHLACLTGFTQSEDGLEPEGPHENEFSDVKCIVDFYGPIDTSKHDDIGILGKTRQEAPWMYRQFSPLSHLNKNDPPVLIIHGEDDTIVEVQHSRVLSEALAKLEIEHELEIIQGAGHGFGIELAEKNILATLLTFLKRHLHTPQ
jgi:acetyl esterase/lipase